MTGEEKSKGSNQMAKPLRDRHTSLLDEGLFGDQEGAYLYYQGRRE